MTSLLVYILSIAAMFSVSCCPVACRYEFIIIAKIDREGQRRNVWTRDDRDTIMTTFYLTLIEELP